MKNLLTIVLVCLMPMCIFAQEFLPIPYTQSSSKATQPANAGPVVSGTSCFSPLPNYSSLGPGIQIHPSIETIGLYAADDFPISVDACMTSVTVNLTNIGGTGGNFGAGVQSSITLIVWEDAGGIPGAQVFNEVVATNLAILPGVNSYTFPVGSPTVLTPGTYWFSIAGTPSDGSLYIAEKAQSLGAEIHTINQTFCALGTGWNPMSGCFPIAPGDLIADITFCAPPAVPTMSQWGLFILSLLFLNLVLVFSAQRKVAIAGTQASYRGENRFFNPTRFAKSLALIAALALGVFVIAVQFFAYEMTSADIPGTLLATPLLAFLVQQLFKD